MAHKTLINGTSYEITGGMAMVEGTGYSIQGGKTMVDGTVYDISFDKTKPVILTVEKVTSDTYAAETTYTGETFILLDVYPKTNGTVKVTYGGLTKTITDTSGAAEPNAQQVFFGTFNGVSDSVTTPESGELTIEGDCVAFGSGTYKTGKTGNARCGSIKEVVDWGENITKIPDRGFQNSALSNLTVPATITEIGVSVFLQCNNLTTVTFLSTTPPTMTGAFDFPTTMAGEYVALQAIIVPKGCGEIYKTTTVWSNYADIIVEAS